MAEPSRPAAGDHRHDIGLSTSSLRAAVKRGEAPSALVRYDPMLLLCMLYSALPATGDWDREACVRSIREFADARLLSGIDAASWVDAAIADGTLTMQAPVSADVLQFANA